MAFAAPVVKATIKTRLATRLTFDEFCEIEDNVRKKLPLGGYDGWYPTITELNKYLTDHPTLNKQDIVFLFSLLTVEENTDVFRRLTPEQTEAFQVVKAILMEPENYITIYDKKTKS